MAFTRNDQGHDLRFDRAGQFFNADFPTNSVPSGNPDDSYHIFGFTSTQQLSETFSDGASIGSAVLNTTPTSATVDQRTYLIGGSVAGSNAGLNNARYYTGDIPEILIFNRALNDAERVVVENHLAAKYDLPIANDYYSGDALPGAYDRDVFGVGQFGTSTLLSAGSAGLGIEITGGLDDGKFIMAGHNLAVNTATEENFGARSDRHWYVDVTGDGLSATFAFSIADADLDGAFSTLGGKLLYADDELLDWQAISAGDYLGEGLFSFTLPASLAKSGFYTVSYAVVPEPSTVALLSLGLVGLVFQARRMRRKQQACVAR